MLRTVFKMTDITLYTDTADNIIVYIMPCISRSTYLIYECIYIDIIIIFSSKKLFTQNLFD